MMPRGSSGLLRRPQRVLGAWAPRGGAGSGGAHSGRAAAPARPLRVLVDMDGVLADFEGGFLKKYRARYPDLPYIALEERRGFWVSEQYGKLQPGLSEKAISIWESKNFFMELDPLPGAVEALKEMAELEATEVFICTSPIKKYRYCPYEKPYRKRSLLVIHPNVFTFMSSAAFQFAWVEKHFGHKFLEHVILTRDKTIVSGHVLIDDRPDIVGVERTPAWDQVLFTACHNKHLQLPASCPRLHSWADDWRAILESKRGC